MLTAITLLPACAAFATACEDIVSSYRATSAQLTRWWIGCARCEELRLRGRQSSGVGGRECWAELFPIELVARGYLRSYNIELYRVKTLEETPMMLSDGVIILMPVKIWDLDVFEIFTIWCTYLPANRK